jgi:hypothetical protein
MVEFFGEGPDAEMRPPERRETGSWFLEREFGAVYTDDPGRPPLPTRLMAGLAILKPSGLKHTCDLSDEVLCER